jgi:hypothetical protein
MFKIASKFDFSNNDLKLFAIVFSVIFAYSHAFPLNGNSIQGVEQWINMTNQMFYGNEDFLFSYGPLYWLTGGTVTQYNVFSYWASLTFLSLTSAVFWYFLIKLSDYFSAWLPFVLVFFLYLNKIVIPPVFLLFPFLIVAYYECISKKIFSNRTAVMLGILVGMLFYVRFLYGMIGAATFGSYLVSKAIYSKNIKATLLFSLSFLLSYFILGLIIFHNISSIKEYAIINSQLNFGNAVDMTYDNVLGRDIWLAFAVIFVAINSYLIFNHPSLLLTFNGLLIIFIKLGFGRADHYLNYFIIPVSVMAMIACFNHKKLWRGAFVFAVCSLYYISDAKIVNGYSIPGPLYTHENFDIDPMDRVAKKYQNYLLPEDILKIIGSQSIDVYPYNNEFIFANKLNYRQRPLFQNYMTLTPVLDGLNKSFYETDDKSQFVLWHSGQNCFDETCNSFDAFDGKYSLNEDPLTSTAIMLNYHIVKSFIDKNHKPVMLLERNKESVVYKLPVESSGESTFDKWIEVPDQEEGIVKIIPHFKLSAYARVKNILYRGDVLYVHYLMSNGEEKRYRLNVLNSSDGVIASPLLSSFPFNGEKVKKIKFTSLSSNYFDKNFTYAWSDFYLNNVVINTSSVGEISSNLTHDGMSLVNQCNGFIESAEFSQGEKQREASLHGWLALSLNGLSTPDEIFIRGTDASGKEYFARARTVVRSDVAEHFGNDKLRRSGFETHFQLPNTTGEKVLSMVALKDKKLYLCNNINYHYQ